MTHCVHSIESSYVSGDLKSDHAWFQAHKNGTCVNDLLFTSRDSVQSPVKLISCGNDGATQTYFMPGILGVTFFFFVNIM